MRQRPGSAWHKPGHNITTQGLLDRKGESMNKEYNSIKAHEAQIEYCKKNEVPHFAPSRYCYACKEDIYSEGGYDVKQAGETLITGCRFCHRSYCD